MCFFCVFLIFEIHKIHSSNKTTSQLSSWQAQRLHLLRPNVLVPQGQQSQIAPWKINMEPKNGGLEDDFPFQSGDFLVPC